MVLGAGPSSSACAFTCVSVWGVPEELLPFPPSLPEEPHPARDITIDTATITANFLITILLFYKMCLFLTSQARQEHGYLRNKYYYKQGYYKCN